MSYKIRVPKGYPPCWGTYKEYPSTEYKERDCGFCGRVLGCAYKARCISGFYGVERMPKALRPK